ncbi:MAG: hypothetical protein AAF703_09505 [Cyanobacteria bacterium P01_D01_bin.105]
MQFCELVDLLTYPGWAIAIGRTELGYRCWVFTPDFTVLDDGEFYATSEAAAKNAKCLISDSREF